MAPDPVGVLVMLLLYPAVSVMWNCNGRSAQFSGSLGNTPDEREGSDGQFHDDKSSPRAATTPPTAASIPSVRTAPRFMSLHRSEARAPCHTPGGANRRAIPLRRSWSG